MKRLDDWPTLLDAFFAERWERPFVWGENDCCLFAADAVLAMTGVDLARNFRGRYDDARGAIEAMHGMPVGEIADYLTRSYGCREEAPLFAQRGDVALLGKRGREVLGVVCLDGMEVLAPGVDCLARAPIADVIRAWRI